MNIGTANYVITRQIQNSNIPFKYQVNLPWNTPVGLPKGFQRKTNWKHWIKYIKPIWCPQQRERDITSLGEGISPSQPLPKPMSFCQLQEYMGVHLIIEAVLTVRRISIKNKTAVNQTPSYIYIIIIIIGCSYQK